MCTILNDRPLNNRRLTKEKKVCGIYSGKMCGIER